MFWWSVSENWRWFYCVWLHKGRWWSGCFYVSCLILCWCCWCFGCCIVEIRFTGLTLYDCMFYWLDDGWSLLDVYLKVGYWKIVCHWAIWHCSLSEIWMLVLWVRWCLAFFIKWFMVWMLKKCIWIMEGISLSLVNVCFVGLMLLSISKLKYIYVPFQCNMRTSKKKRTKQKDTAGST